MTDAGARPPLKRGAILWIRICAIGMFMLGAAGAYLFARDGAYTNVSQFQRVEDRVVSVFQSRERFRMVTFFKVKGIPTLFALTFLPEDSRLIDEGMIASFYVPDHADLHREGQYGIWGLWLDGKQIQSFEDAKTIRQFEVAYLGWMALGAFVAGACLMYFAHLEAGKLRAESA